jgi:Transposase DDE domain
MAIDITALYCCLDDFCKLFEDWEAHRLIPSERTRQRPGKLSLSERMLIMVLFHLSPFKPFKAFYHYGIGHQHRACFREIPYYDRFVSLMPRLFTPLMILLHSLSGEETGIYFADSTKLAVCHNRRIHRHKVFDGLAARGKTSMGEAGQRFRRRRRWKGQMRVVLRAQAAFRDQPQEPDHGLEDHPGQQSR